LIAFCRLGSHIFSVNIYSVKVESFSIVNGNMG
jgi:hypothetical protein